MKCAFCGAELREGAKFCTQCGMAAAVQPEKEIPSFPAYDYYEPAGEAARDCEPEVLPDPAAGYRSYTGEKLPPRAPRRPGDNSRDWAAGAALACAVCSVATILFCIPGLVFGIGAVVFGFLGKNSNLRPLAIGSIVLGSLGVLGSAAMIFVWSGLVSLIGELMTSLTFPSPFFW